MTERFSPPKVWGLTGHEMDTLNALLSARDTASKPAIMDYVYGVGRGPEIKIIDVFVCKLRKKLAPHFDPATLNHLELIETVWGKGYRISDEAKALIRAHDAYAPLTTGAAA
jgi:DNA-binding response OmpR family regulator